jgi:hypothetical protein
MTLAEFLANLNHSINMSLAIMPHEDDQNLEAFIGQLLKILAQQPLDCLRTDFNGVLEASVGFHRVKASVNWWQDDTACLLCSVKANRVNFESVQADAIVKPMPFQCAPRDVSDGGKFSARHQFPQVA